ncbi:MAG: flavin reductase [Acidobacteriota bacterium]
MINIEAMFKITYGLYVVCSGDKESGNGFISNTVFQVSSKPAKFAAACHKNNFTSGVIVKNNCFSVSILHKETDPELFGRFGYKSGKDYSKLDGMEIKYGETGVPIVLNDAIAYLECKVVQKLDVGSHWLFIGELADAQIVNEQKEPITYDYYRKINKGAAPQNAPTYIESSELVDEKEQVGPGNYKCAACGYIFNENKEGVIFTGLPDKWTCPVCGADKKVFREIL